MSTHFKIDADGLRSHAAVVTTAASSIREAASAGASTIDASAFGIMCSFLAPPAALVTGALTATINHLAGEVDELSREVRTMAGNYDTSEQVASSGYRAAKRDFRTLLGPS